MTDWPGPGYTRATISTFSRQCFAAARQISGADPGTASATWPQANITVYYPLLLEAPMLVTKLFWVNGTVVSGNCALAVYKTNTTVNNQSAQLFTTGTTAQAGTSAVQKVTLGTPVLLTPGLYQLGLGCDNTTATFVRNAVSNAVQRAAGCQAEGTYPPPSPSNYQGTGQSYWALCGISNDPTL